MVKVVRLKFQKCLFALTMLLIEWSSEEGLFRHFFNHLFRVRNLGNNSAMTDIFFRKCLKVNLAFEIDKKIEKMFFVSQILGSEFSVLTCFY